MRRSQYPRRGESPAAAAADNGPPPRSRRVARSSQQLHEIALAAVAHFQRENMGVLLAGGPQFGQPCDQLGSLLIMAELDQMFNRGCVERNGLAGMGFLSRPHQLLMDRRRTTELAERIPGLVVRVFLQQKSH